jgi:hypothetical protein
MNAHIHTLAQVQYDAEGYPFCGDCGKWMNRNDLASAE